MATTISIMIFRPNYTGVCLGCTLGNVVAKLLTAIAPLNMEVIIYYVASQTHITSNKCKKIQPTTRVFV